MRSIRQAVALCAVLIESATGCGTIISRSFIPDPVTERNQGAFRQACFNTPWLPRIYSGAVFDWWAAGDPVAVLFAFELPLSLAADTIILPLTIYEQVNHGDFTKDCPARPTRSTSPPSENSDLAASRRPSPGSRKYFTLPGVALRWYFADLARIQLIPPTPGRRRDRDQRVVLPNSSLPMDARTGGEDHRRYGQALAASGARSPRVRAELHWCRLSRTTGAGEEVTAPSFVFA